MVITDKMWVGDEGLSVKRLTELHEMGEELEFLEIGSSLDFEGLFPFVLMPEIKKEYHRELLIEKNLEGITDPEAEKMHLNKISTADLICYVEEMERDERDRGRNMYLAEKALMIG